MKITKFFKLPLLALLFVLHSCQHEDLTSDDNREVNSVKIPNHIVNKLQKLGFVVDEYSYPYEDGYIVEGDIKITENQIDKMLEKQGEVTNRHYVTDDLVSTGSSRVIKVWIDTKFSSAMRNRILEALGRYNALKLRLTFTTTTSLSGADIKIFLSPYVESGSYATAGLPSYGAPYYEIKMNNKYYNTSKPPGNTVSVVTHEIGHCIGFRHMDYKDISYSCGGSPRADDTLGGVNPVAGTGNGNTPNSWMLACTSGSANRPFILTDKIALYNLYGRFRDRGDVFLRYRKGSGGHFYTRNYNEVREGNSFFTSQGIMCRMYPNGGTGRKPVYRYYNTKNGNHFYTINFNELGNGNSRFRYEGVAGYVFSSNSRDRVALYRYYSPSKDFHFYTTDYSEMGSGADGYHLESILGYTYPNK
ncbi:M57 family metalloprotease [Ascidiimonas sp. W6]|uniref:M57 family metalloprotease n=1 Tax=Ascidiimonas meishanensis TaxID=3128903 RepID=UPI0030EE1CB1